MTAVRGVAVHADPIEEYLVARHVADRPGVTAARGALATDVRDGAPGAVLWGCRVDDVAAAAPRPGADVRSVRGPWTGRLLAHHGLVAPAVHGHPLYLAARVLPELERLARVAAHDVLVAPDPADPGLAAEARRAGYPVLDPDEHPAAVLAAVATARAVVGSWLPAVVVAEALGRDARSVAAPTVHPFAARDLLAGTGRPLEPVARGLAEALDLGAAARPQVDLDVLADSFPWDLWGLGEPPERRADDEPAAGGDDAWVRRLDGDPGAVLGRDPAGWADRLGEVVGRVRAEGAVPPADELAALRAERRWSWPEAPADALRGDAGLLDAALRGPADDEPAVMLGRMIAGPAARAVSFAPRESGSLLGITLDVVAPGRAVASVRLAAAGHDEVVVPGHLLPGRHRGRLDLDVVVPWARLPERATVDVRYTTGDADSLPLDLPLDTDREV